MNKTKIAVAAVAAALALSGCGGQTDNNTGTGATVEPAVSSSEPPAGASEPASVEPVEPAVSGGASESSSRSAAAKSERGNLIKKPGDSAGITDESGTPIIEFTVHSIKVDPKCTGEYAEKSENGHLIALDVSVQTKRLGDMFAGGWSMSPYSFKTIAPNGTTSNADLGTMATYSCFDDSKNLPSDIGSAENARGMVVLDAETATGTLVFQDPYAMAGWEWEYPAK